MVGYKYYFIQKIKDMTIKKRGNASLPIFMSLILNRPGA